MPTHTACAWCGEPAHETGIDTIGRTHPIGPGGYHSLCTYCERVNNYLWDAADTIHHFERENTHALPVLAA